MECNLCGCTEFVDMATRVAVKCRSCGSLERTRLLWLHLEALPITPDWRILHIAPEAGVAARLSRKVTPGNYVAADYNPHLYPWIPDCRRIDLADLDAWSSDAFDLILHVHVLEHVPCTIAYPLFHLHRMLKPSGRHVFAVPFRPGTYEECLDDIGEDERKRRFGQVNHLRNFGRDGLDAHLGKILRLPPEFDAARDFGSETLHRFNVPEPQWRGWNISTVFVLPKDAHRLR